jgi:hypothetical protein
LNEKKGRTGFELATEEGILRKWSRAKRDDSSVASRGGLL